MGKVHTTAVLVSLAITVISRVRTQASTTCTAGYYKSGEKATITCHYYGENNIATHDGAFIQWRELGAGDQSTGKEAVMCHFNGGSLQACDREKGYSFVDFHNTSLTIAVDAVSAQFQGSYSCGVVTPTGVSARTVRPCLLVVEGATSSDIDVQQSPEKLKSLQRSFQATLTLLIIFIVMAVGAIAYIIFAYRRKWFPFGLPDTSQNEEEELLDNVTTQSVQTQTENPPEILEGTSGLQSEFEASGKKEGAYETESETENKLKKKNEAIENSLKKLKNSLKKGVSSEDKKRIEKEHDEMIKRSKIAAQMEQKRILEEYYNMLQSLKEEKNKRIQEEYDNLNKRL